LAIYLSSDASHGEAPAHGTIVACPSRRQDTD
jgi:hypothetical protein